MFLKVEAKIMAKVLEYLSSKCEVLRSNPSIKNKQMKKKMWAENIAQGRVLATHTEGLEFHPQY
jgi:hypothetical protein